jgi:hypothetical protein
MATAKKIEAPWRVSRPVADQPGEGRSFVGVFELAQPVEEDLIL